MFDDKGIDVVIPLGNGSKFRDCELRYCLRSLERHATGIRRVVIIGHRPKWLSHRATHIACPHFDGPKDSRIALKTLWAFERTDISNEVLFANDDYVFLEPFDVRLVPPYQRGPLLTAATPAPGVAQNKYQKLLQATHELLLLGKLPALDYDIHVPIRYVREKFIGLKPWWDKSKASRTGYVVKSIYGNATRKTVPGPFLPDFKLGLYKSPEEFEALLARFPGRFCISYGDRPLYDNFETWLYNRFPVKSRFEL